MCILNGELRPALGRGQSSNIDLYGRRRQSTGIKSTWRRRSVGSSCRRRKMTPSSRAASLGGIEATKMKAVITAPAGGVVKRLHHTQQGG